MAILISGDYVVIRSLVDLLLDDRGLADSVIASSVYESRAESIVQDWDALALTRTDPTEVMHVKNAVIMVTASLICRIMQTGSPVTFKMDGLFIIREKVDWLERERELIYSAKQELSRIAGVSLGIQRTKQFGTSQGVWLTGFFQDGTFNVRPEPDSEYEGGTGI